MCLCHELRDPARRWTPSVACKTALSARRCRVAHSPTFRRLPPKPEARSRRQSSAALRHPATHSCSSCGSHGVKPFRRTRKTSSRSPRTIRRTRPRLSPSFTTIELLNQSLDAPTAHNPLDRNTFIGHSLDRLVGLLASLEAFVLQTLGRSTHGRVGISHSRGAADYRGTAASESADPARPDRYRARAAWGIVEQRPPDLGSVLPPRMP